MKPYCKTFRASKVHKAKDCGICSEDTSGGKNYARQRGKKDMSDDLMDSCHNEDCCEADNTYQQTCDYCERVVTFESSTGEAVAGESCGEISCPLLSQEREGGDPQPLDFNDSGC